jgi:cation diffusion facilitator family transporter
MENSPEKYMFSAVKISLAGNIILFSIKAATLVVVHSLAVATDLAISLVSLLVSIMLFNSVKMAHRPANWMHNYGYGKVENVCEAMEGIIILGIAFAISFQALLTLMHPRDMTSPWIGLATSAAGIAVNLAGGAYIGLMARKSGSPSIKAEELHYYLEAFISTTITLAFAAIIALEHAGRDKISDYVDPIAAFIISIVIAIPSFKLAKEAFFKLLDSSMEEHGKLEVIKHLSKHIDMYCEFADLKTRTAGMNKFIELRVILPDELSFVDGHLVAKHIEEDIQRNIPHSAVRVTMEPCRKDCLLGRSSKCPYLAGARKKVHEGAENDK